MSRTALLEELESIKFPLAVNRNNIKRGGKSTMGFVLGKVRNRGSGLKYDTRVIRDSRRSNEEKYAKVYELAKALIKKEKPNFKYNSIQFNKNARTARHLDGNNVGISSMITLGDYTGGNLLIFDEDEKNPQSVKTKNRWITFNGSKYPHETEPFKGTRYSIVYYYTGSK
tara:strand:- start:119 stop:628 length:510 start_codon:yes stop_codon:yes gene_type:complete